MNNPIAANVLGTIGAICWSIQLIPQIIINHNRHHTTGLQPTMMLLWATAGIPLGVYNITQNFNIALQIQPQILTFLSLVTWAQCKYYRDGGSEDEKRWNWLRCIIVVSGLGVFMGGVEVALVFALRQAVKRDLKWPGISMAVLAALLLCAGVARHYWDIYTERTVRGISFLFVGIDAMGDLTSLISVFFQKDLDVLGLVIYGSELVLWSGVFACGGWYNFRPWIKSMSHRWGEKQAESNNDITMDESPDGEAVERQNVSSSTSRSPDRVYTESHHSTSTVFRTASSTSSDKRQNPSECDNIRLRHVPSV